MAPQNYERLAGLDHTFLVFESARTHMHVAATLIFDAKPLTRPEGGIDIERIRAYTASRLHLIPRYRERLAYTPLDRHPIWIDDDHFNIEYHVRHTCLPSPGDERQLKRLAGRIMSQQLDRDKPLWEIWVVEGLQHDRCALVTKTHHCMIDGVAAVDLLAVLMRPEPTESIEEAPPYIPRPAPDRIRLLRDEVRRLAWTPFALARGARRWLEEPEELRSDLRERMRGLAETLGVGLAGAGDTPLNQPIGPHRRFDWVSMDLGVVRNVKNRLGGTVNDVVLATVTGAVREFLRYRRVDVEALSFRVLAPVSVRRKDERGTLGNRVSVWFVDLPIAERDPRVRLEQIRETTAELKESKQALGASLLTRASEWTGSTLLSMGVQILHRALPFNLVVTNVPGPQVPLYLLGSQLQECYPQVPLFMGQGLGVALFSYAGRLNWGFNADWDRVPDLSLFADAIVASFKELRDAAASPGHAVGPPPRQAPLHKPSPPASTT